MIVGSVGEAFNSNAPSEHFDDLKRGVVYILLTVIIFSGIMFYYDQSKPDVIPPKTVETQSIKITELSVVDIHNKNIMFAIGYKDATGRQHWHSTFSELSDRTEYINTLVKDGKFKVEIYFKINKYNKGSLEILKQTIKDK